MIKKKFIIIYFFANLEQMRPMQALLRSLQQVAAAGAKAATMLQLLPPPLRLLRPQCDQCDLDITCINLMTTLQTNFNLPQKNLSTCLFGCNLHWYTCYHTCNQVMQPPTASAATSIRGQSTCFHSKMVASSVWGRFYTKLINICIYKHLITYLYCSEIKR